MEYKGGGRTVELGGRPVLPEQAARQARDFLRQWGPAFERAERRAYEAEHPEAPVKASRPVGLLAELEHTLAEAQRILEATR